MTSFLQSYTGGVVRGVTQRHLRRIMEFAELDRVKFVIVFLDSKTAIQMTIEEIHEFFII